MSDQKIEPSSDVLRSLAQEREDQPGDLAKTKTDRDIKPVPSTDELESSS